MNMTNIDLRRPDHCLCFNLRGAARLVTRAYDEALAPARLTATQFSSLAVLDEKGPLTMTAFADIMKLERTTLTRNLARLEEEKLIRRSSGADLRQRVVRITAKGIRRLKAALPLWEKAQARLAAALGFKTAAGILEIASRTKGALQ